MEGTGAGRAVRLVAAPVLFLLCRMRIFLRTMIVFAYLCRAL